VPSPDQSLQTHQPYTGNRREEDRRVDELARLAALLAQGRLDSLAGVFGNRRRFGIGLRLGPTGRPIKGKTFGDELIHGFDLMLIGAAS